MIPSPGSRLFVSLSLVLIVAACATTPPRRYAMPSDLSRARAPEQAAPDNAAELAEATLSLLDPSRPGGPDLEGAARLCLLAAEVADPRVERELRRACFRTAARSALRSGNRALYAEVIDRWEDAASRSELIAGELVAHRAIRDRMQAGQAVGPMPPELRGWLHHAEARP